MSVGIVRWVECTVTDASYFKLSTEHCPLHLALLDEVVTCHPLLHTQVLDLLIRLFESKQDELEILVQVSRSCKITFCVFNTCVIYFPVRNEENGFGQNGQSALFWLCCSGSKIYQTVLAKRRHGYLFDSIFCYRSIIHNVFKTFFSQKGFAGFFRFWKLLDRPIVQNLFICSCRWWKMMR